MGDRLYYLALTVSLVVHLSVIGYLSWTKTQIFRKPLKQIEVVYQKIASKAQVKPMENVKSLQVEKNPDPIKKVELLPKKIETKPDIFDRIKDISKMSDRMRIQKKQTPRINMPDIDRKVTVSMVKSEKISNPKYLNYRQIVRERIRQQAYTYADYRNLQAGVVYLTFIISSDGHLKGVKVIDGRSQANANVKQIGLGSIEGAAPFPPFPKDLTYPELTFNIEISFRISD